MNGQMFFSWLKILTDGDHIATIVLQGLSGSEPLLLFVSPSPSMMPLLVRMPPAFSVLITSILRQYFACMRTWRVSLSTVSILWETTSGAASMMRCIYLPFAFKIRNQCFKRCIGIEFFDGPDGIIPYNRTAIFQFIAIYRSNHRMFHFHQINRFCHTLRFIPVNRIRTAGSNCTKATTPGAGIAKNHKCSGTGTPAFTHIRAITAFANGVKLMTVNEMPDLFVIFADR